MASPRATWYSKFEVQLPGVTGDAIKILNFRGAMISDADWAAACAAGAAEVAARPAAAAAAEAALYQRVDVPRISLPDGHSIPAIGLGTWKAERGAVREAVHCALQV